MEPSSDDYGTLICPGIPTAHEVKDGIFHESYSFRMPGMDIHFDDNGLMLGDIKSGSIDCVVTDPAYLWPFAP